MAPLCRQRAWPSTGCLSTPNGNRTPVLAAQRTPPSNSPPSGNGNADAEAAAPVVQKTQFVVDGQGPYKRWF